MRPSLSHASIAWIAFLFAAIAQPARGGMTFTLNDTGGAGVGTDARLGFEEAANFWSSQFSDNININLDIGFQSLGAGILGQTDAQVGIISYSGYRFASLFDAKSADDLTYTAALPTGSSFSMYLNRTADNPNGAGSATPYVDNDGGGNNSTVFMAFANAKALGLLPAVTLDPDGSVKFSSDFTFDFDRSNGITAGAFDFVGVAIHEIGHALGFLSGVDILDGNPLATEDALARVTPLDFTRFSEDSQAAGADLDWTADARPKYFSIDGGTTTIRANAWSTGVNFGDGRQDSHWKDNFSLGIMDPTGAPGELLQFGSLDRQAFDVIGYDLAAVPEPTSLAMLGCVLGGLAVRYRRRLLTMRAGLPTTVE